MITKETKVNDLQISVRLRTVFERAGIRTLGELLEYDEATLMRLKNFGRKCLKEVVALLDYHGLRLGVPIISATYRVSDRKLAMIVRGWEGFDKGETYPQRPSDKVAMAAELMALRSMIARRL